MVERGELAELVVSIGAVRLGEFTLSSGMKSSVYVDLREFPMHPREFREAISIVSRTMEALMRDYDAEVVAGVATGGIPWAIGVGLTLGVPSTYVRPQAKDHGRGRVVEGDVNGRTVIVVDDVATTGSSLVSAVEALRAAGARVPAALVVVDRGSGASERLGAIGVRLHAVETLRGILSYMASKGFGEPLLLRSALKEVGLT